MLPVPDTAGSTGDTVDELEDGKLKAKGETGFGPDEAAGLAAGFFFGFGAAAAAASAASSAIASSKFF